MPHAVFAEMHEMQAQQARARAFARYPERKLRDAHEKSEARGPMKKSSEGGQALEGAAS